MHTHSVSQLQLLHLTLSVSNVITLRTLREGYRNIFSVYFNYTADIAVENILFIVIANLHNLVTHTQYITRYVYLELGSRRRIKIFLQQLIQILHAAGILVHRRQHLHPAPVTAGRKLGIGTCYKFRSILLVGKLLQRKLAVGTGKKLRHLPTVNLMGITDNRTHLCLTENIFQTYNRHSARTDHILKHRACTHGRQLVHVTDENQTAAAGNCLKQMIGQADIEHRSLIDNNCFRIQRIAVILAEAQAVTRRLVFQQTMHRCRRMTGRISQPACSATGRRSQQNAAASLLQNVQNTLNDGCFTCTGTAGENENAMLQRSINRLTLCLCQRNTGITLPFGNNLIRINARHRLRLVTQLQQTACGLHLRRIQIFRIYQAYTAHFLRAQQILLHQAAENILHHGSVNRQRSCRFTHQQLLRHTGVSYACGLRQRISNACAQAFLAVMLHAHSHSNSVRSFKTYAGNILRQAIGILLNAGNRRSAVGCLQASCVTAAHAVRFQKHHQLAQTGKLAVRFTDSGSLFGADAAYLCQALGIASQNLQRIRSKGLHNSCRRHRPYTLHSAGSQKAFNACYRSWLQNLQCLYIKLSAESGMLNPVAFHSHIFAHVRRIAMINGSKSSLRLAFHTQHAEHAVIALKHYIINYRFQLFHFLTATQNKCFNYSYYYNIVFSIRIVI